MTTKIVPIIKSTFSQPFLSLAALVELENSESSRRGNTKLSWWADALTLSGSTLAKSWKAIIFITLWSTIVAVLDIVYHRSLALTNSITPLLSIVLGLLLVFRTTSAFTRWENGRLCFATLVTVARTLTRSVIINVSQKSGNGDVLSVESKNVLDESKIAFCRMTVGFVIATKNHSRGQYGSNTPDLKSTLPAAFHQLAHDGYGLNSTVGEIQAQELDRMARSHPLAFQDPRSNHGRKRSATIAQESSERSPLIESEIFDEFLAKPNVPLPLIIAHQLGIWLNDRRKDGSLEAGPLYNGLSTQIDKLVETFTTIEKASIPIPRLFNVHLKQATSAFLLTLPFVLVEILGWKMVPATSLIAFTLIGIEIIALEVEYPFGLDDSDLPLDLLCGELRNEIEHTIARLESKVEVW